MRSTDEPNSRDHDRREQRGLHPLPYAGLMLAICLFLASLAPGPLIAASLSSLASIAASVAAATALLRGETIAWDAFNRWDVALAFFALSIGAGWLVDVEAVRSFAEAQAAAGSAE